MNLEEVKSILNKLLNNEKLADNLLVLDENLGADLELLGKSISALSNSANLAGIQNSILLIKIGKGADEYSVGSNLTEIKESLFAVPNVEILNNIEFEGKLSIAILVGASFNGYPASFKGHYYKINNKVIKPLSFREFDRIRYTDFSTSWLEHICKSAKIADLNENAVKKAIIGFKSKHMHLEAEINTWNEKEFLNRIGLMKNDKLTNAAIFLLGREEAEHLISDKDFGFSWIVKDVNGNEKGYQNFGLPVILNVDSVLSKISNLKYDYSTDTQFAPVETTKYESHALRELIINALAHQDYNVSAKINIVEEPDKLIVSNAGAFIFPDVDYILDQEYPVHKYRNPFFTRVLEKLNMMDQICGGIRKIMNLQRKKNFPMPDFNISVPNEVNVVLYGKVINKDYTEKLISNPNLTLSEVRALDKVQKRKQISEEHYSILREKKLVSGRYPDLTIASRYSSKTGEKQAFVPKKVLSTQELKDLVVSHLGKAKEASRGDIDKLLRNKYPTELPDDKKRNKIKNLLYQMSRVDNTIKNVGSATKPIWTLS